MNRSFLFVGVLWLLLAAAIIVSPLLISPEIRVEWTTGTEYNTAGFNVYRSETADGEFEQINEQLIPSQAGMVSGATYVFVDRQVRVGQTYYYMLEDVEYSNARHRHEIVTGSASFVTWWSGGLALASALVGFFLIGAALRRQNG